MPQMKRCMPRRKQRDATIENADQILVIDSETVAQRGKHKQLLGQEGTYREFIRIREEAEGWQIQ